LDVFTYIPAFILKSVILLLYVSNVKISWVCSVWW